MHPAVVAVLVVSTVLSTGVAVYSAVEQKKQAGEAKDAREEQIRMASAQRKRKAAIAARVAKANILATQTNTGGSAGSGSLQAVGSNLKYQLGLFNQEQSMNYYASDLQAHADTSQAWASGIGGVASGVSRGASIWYDA